MNSHFKDLWPVYLLLVVFVVGIAGATVAAVRDAEEWGAFSKAHACKVVARKRGQSVTVAIAGADGRMSFGTETTPSQTAYLCNDGVTYWR